MKTRSNRIVTSLFSKKNFINLFNITTETLLNNDFRNTCVSTYYQGEVHPTICRNPKLKMTETTQECPESSEAANTDEQSF